MEVHDVESYITWNLPQAEFYIQEILPKQGVMLLYGSPKVRKSWLAQYMAFCISTGADCLGLRTEQARVFLANFEISPVAYAWRLRNMARNFELQPQMLYEGTQMLMYLDEQASFNRFVASLRTVEPKVIVLDCFAMSFGGDENNGEQMARYIGKVSEIKDEFDASVIIVHHTNKNVLATNSVDRARGHSRLAGWVDTLAYLCEQPSGLQLQIKARQATRELPNMNLRFEDYMWSRR